MENNLKIFGISFVVIGIINQAFYGFCFKSYCLSVAFPKVLILSVLVTVALSIMNKD
jgi:tryptophan-rich sensory protein